MTHQRQMELGLDQAQAFRIARRSQARLSRAQWWFQQMRQVVNQSLDWQPVPPGRPEQTRLALSNRPQTA